MKLLTGSSRAQGSGPGTRSDDPRGDGGWFFDVNQVGIGTNQKDVKMKSAPNNILKTKGRISDIMDYPNKVLKEIDLTEIRY